MALHLVLPLMRTPMPSYTLGLAATVVLLPTPCSTTPPRTIASPFEGRSGGQYSMTMC